MRRKAKVNYRESSLSLNDTNLPNIEDKKVPVYKQQQNVKTKKINKDLYEFDSDSENEKIKKKKRKDSDESNKYDKTMQEIMQNILKRKEFRKNPTKVVKPNKKPVTIKRKQVVQEKDNIIVNPASNEQAQCQCDDISRTPPASLRPWRFDTNMVTRNPHFLTLKDSSLPSINQDMVLDHSFVKSPLPTPKPLTALQSTPNVLKERLFVQKNIMDYLNHSTDDLSALSTLSPKRRTQIFEEDKENYPVSPKKPFRFNLRPNLKTVVVEEPSLKKVKSFENIVASKEFELPEEYEGSYSEKIQLFEEPELLFSKPEKIYRIKKRKIPTETDDIDEERPVKKKSVEDIKREAEFTKWANNFNSICKEIEQHELEIE